MTLATLHHQLRNVDWVCEEIQEGECDQPCKKDHHIFQAALCVATENSLYLHVILIQYMYVLSHSSKRSPKNIYRPALPAGASSCLVPRNKLSTTSSLDLDIYIEGIQMQHYYCRIQTH